VYPVSDNKPDDPTASSKRKWLWLKIALLLLAVVAALLFWYLRKPDLWQETSVPYDPACTSDCIEAGSIGGAHGTKGATFYYDPAIDDAVAQWGDCVQSIFVCIEKGGDPAASLDEKAKVVRDCVAASACPAACTDRFAARAGTTPEGVQTAFDALFLQKNAWCEPEGGERR